MLNLQDPVNDQDENIVEICILLKHDLFIE